MCQCVRVCVYVHAHWLSGSQVLKRSCAKSVSSSLTNAWSPVHNLHILDLSVG